MDLQIKEKTISLIDSLKSTCQTYGMGNDGNEYKIITQVFLYKYLNDKYVDKLNKKVHILEQELKRKMVSLDHHNLLKEQMYQAMYNNMYNDYEEEKMTRRTR